ncbi:2-amino-4-hydroxy-6-hydroxymethyldihydropteridinepyrophosphokinase [invertebrate metagenome]|uniref:2-amino-4-hydroxy-6-hydroxymethyldihydropteridine diphosphokinase n=1 Tax=invertebrate metagenome TaxID=1711999 RepID=A0A484H874_9ZZZZ
MILIGIGANLPWSGTAPRSTCTAALSQLAIVGVVIIRRSRWIESAPVPPSDQPWFTNGVALIRTSLGPVELLAALHQVETIFNRVRTVPNAPRVLDLDLLAYHDLVCKATPILPHPRLHKRAFVMWPLAEIVPYWRHPTSGQTASQIAISLPPGQRIRWLRQPRQQACLESTVALSEKSQSRQACHLFWKVNRASCACASPVIPA